MIERRKRQERIPHKWRAATMVASVALLVAAVAFDYFEIEKVPYPLIFTVAGVAMSVAVYFFYLRAGPRP